MNARLCTTLLLAMALLGFTILVKPIQAASPSLTSGGEAILLINQTSREFPGASTRLGDQIELLLRHFTTRVNRTDDTGYAPGQAAIFDRVVVVGNDSVTPFPEALLTDLAKLDRPILWIQHGLDQLPVDLRTASGFSLGYVTRERLPDSIQYQGQQYPAHPAEIRQLQITSSTAEVLASYTGPGITVPYIVHGKNLWYVNGVPSLSPGQLNPANDAPALIFADSLHHFFGEDTGESRQAVIRVADVTVDLDPDRLRKTAEFLYQRRIPYTLSVTPSKQMTDGQIVTLRERPGLIEALRYAQAHGATIVLQGARSSTNNDCFEFSETARGAPPSGRTRDSYVRALEYGVRTLRDVGIEPRMWETPCFTASPLAYQVFAQYFPYAVENPGPDLWSPYLTGPDQYGTTRVPVVTGAIIRARGETVAVQLQRADTLRIVRDSWMVGYYNPDTTPLVELEALLTGLQRADYSLGDLRAFPAQTLSGYQPNNWTQFRSRASVDLPIELIQLDRWLTQHFPGWRTLQRVPWGPVAFVALTALFVIRLREQWRPPHVVATSSVEQPIAQARARFSRRFVFAILLLTLVGIGSLAEVITVRNGAASSRDNTLRLRGWSDLDWTVKYDGYGTVGYMGDTANLEPQAVGALAKTSAALALAGDPEWRDYSFTVRMHLDQQLRQNDPPNPWETGWLFFRYQADDRAYYLAHKVNGLELGKLVPATGGSQVFLATTPTPPAELGRWYDYRIDITGATIRVYVDGQLQMEYTDLDPIPSGRVGLYTEDARVLFQQPSVASLPVQAVATTPGAATRTAVGASAQPTAGAMPGAPAQPSSVPTPTPPALATVYQRALAAESSIRTGQLRATIDYGNGTRSKIVAEFDLNTPALHLVIDYESTTGSRRDEFVTINDRSWQRRSARPWVAGTAQEGVSEQLARYLPGVASTPVSAVAGDLAAGSLYWLNADGTVETTITIDPATGALRAMRHVPRSNGSTLAVTYSDINSPVQIVPPVATP